MSKYFKQSKYANNKPAMRTKEEPNPNDQSESVSLQIEHLRSVIAEYSETMSLSGARISQETEHTLAKVDHSLKTELLYLTVGWYPSDVRFVFEKSKTILERITGKALNGFN